MSMRRALLLLSVALGLAFVPAVWAHANLLRSDPVASAALDTSPQTISLWFTEPLEPNFSTIRLLDAQGNPIATPPSAVDPADTKHLMLSPGTLPDGLYTVSWRVISAADGHSTTGSYAFAVGGATGLAAFAAPDTETIPPLAAPVRWFDLLSLSLAVGSVAFAVCVTCAPPQERGMRRLMGIGWVLVGIAALALLVYQSLQATDAGLGEALSAFPTILLQTRFGTLLLIRIVIWLAFGAAVWRRRYGIGLVLGGALLLVHSFYSHASATYDLIPSVAGDWLHLAATALWVGGLAQFINVLLMVRTEPHSLVPLVARFSNYARVCVAVLVVTGLYAAWLEVGSVEALTHSLYGRALIVKGVLFAPLLVIALVNLVLTPRGLKAGNSVWAKRLRGLVGAEIALTLGIFAAVAVMASADPSRSSLARRLPTPDHTLSSYEPVDDIHIHLDVIPGWVGQNRFVVTLLTEDGDLIDDATLIRVRFDNQTQNVGRSELRPESVGHGQYEANGANLSVPGTWRARVTVQRPDKFDALADFTLEMTAAPVPPGLDMSVPLEGRQWALLLTGLALLAIGGFAGGRGTFQPFREVGILITATLVVGVILLIGGIV